MVVGAWELSGDNSLIQHIFLSAGLVKNAEADLIEESREHQNKQHVKKEERPLKNCLDYRFYDFVNFSEKAR
jgi:hypothetical protein